MQRKFYKPGAARRLKPLKALSSRVADTGEILNDSEPANLKPESGPRVFEFDDQAIVTDEDDKYSFLRSQEDDDLLHEEYSDVSNHERMLTDEDDKCSIYESQEDEDILLEAPFEAFSSMNEHDRISYLESQEDRDILREGYSECDYDDLLERLANADLNDEMLDCPQMHDQEGPTDQIPRRSGTDHSSVSSTVMLEDIVVSDTKSSCTPQAEDDSYLGPPLSPLFIGLSWHNPNSTDPEIMLDTNQASLVSTSPNRHESRVNLLASPLLFEYSLHRSNEMNGDIMLDSAERSRSGSITPWLAMWLERIST